jgi:hypothetical protein
VLDCSVIGRCMQRHRHQEFIRFLNEVERSVPAGKLIHVVLDNYGAHKPSRVRAWLARHPRWTFHFTPISGSWLNAVETFFFDAHPPAAEARRVPLDRRAAGRDQPLSRRAQPSAPTLHLDPLRRCDPRPPRPNPSIFCVNQCTRAYSYCVESGHVIRQYWLR